MTAQFRSQDANLPSWSLCAGCSGLPKCQLGIETISLVDRRTAAATLGCPASYAGGPAVAHGGWTAAVLDEVIGQFFALHHQLAVTATLTVDYHRPVPIERALLIKARVESRSGFRWQMSADLLLAATAARLASASGVWVERDQGHFDRYERWLRDQVELRGAPTD